MPDEIELENVGVRPKSTTIYQVEDGESMDCETMNHTSLRHIVLSRRRWFVKEAVCQMEVGVYKKYFLVQIISDLNP